MVGGASTFNLTMQAELLKIRDKRKDSRYYIDNEFIDGYAKHVGWQGQVVYSALCRHAKNETCFPSYQHLMTELNVSRRAIWEGITALKKYNIIEVQQRTRTKGGRSSNTYILLDRKEWSPVAGWSNQKESDKIPSSIPLKP